MLAWRSRANIHAGDLIFFGKEKKEKGLRLRLEASLNPFPELNEGIC
jgi:hypothetical protein